VTSSITVLQALLWEKIKCI